MFDNIIKKPPQATETQPEKANEAPPKSQRKHNARHHHHHHDHPYIEPVSTGTPSLNPGAISIGRR